MTKIVIIGGGIIGAAIAYELSQVAGWDIHLIEQHTPASGATGAALGVLMGIISLKTKGRSWKLRQKSMERFETLIPELEKRTGDKIPYNRQGILTLQFEGEDLEKWRKLAQIRNSQGYTLEIWDRSQLNARCPQIQNERVTGALYSPSDRQVDPTKLTHALLKGSSQSGVNCQFDLKVQNLLYEVVNEKNNQQCTAIKTENGIFNLDYLVIAAGIGSSLLSEQLHHSIPIRAVLGQAMRLKLEHSLEDSAFQPVITGNDLHIVPLGQGEYWIGATVEFPNEQGDVQPEPTLLEKMREEAIAFYPDLAKAKIIQTWQGKRPRPFGQPAPVIQALVGFNNVLLATGHYRNGVLLAPATALEIREMILSNINQ